MISAILTTHWKTSGKKSVKYIRHNQLSISKLDHAGSFIMLGKAEVKIIKDYKIFVIGRCEKNL